MPSDAEPKPGERFRWRVHEGQAVNRIILPALRGMTGGHCAYCDGFPIETVSRETIDHFRPKSLFPELAYLWENLFLACDRCQAAKADYFSSAMLKPDEDEYAFQRFFQVDFKTGRLEPNSAAPEADQERASITIRALRLNEHGRPMARIRALKDFGRLAPEEQSLELRDFPYRFMLS